MSTRSRIGIIYEDGSVRSIYCHYDGYPTGVGRGLLDHWTDQESVNALMNLGAISILGSAIGQKHNFDKHREPFKGGPSPDERGWTLAYGRDRGERDVGCQADKSMSEFSERLKDAWDIEWCYLFDATAGAWLYCDPEHNPYDGPKNERDHTWSAWTREELEKLEAAEKEDAA